MYDVAKFYLNILNGGESIRWANETNIVLISKVKELKFMAQFRPISLLSTRLL